MKPFQLKVEKPWGYEFVFTPPKAPTVGKLLHLNAGCRFSLQYHEVKEETMVLVNGKANIYLGNTRETVVKQEMLLNHGYLITPGTIHRCEALTDCDILESSTKEEGATIRLEDDYNRNNETEKSRKLERS